MTAFHLIEPATGEQLTSIEQATAEDVDRAVRAGHKAFQSWSKTNPRERGRIDMVIVVE